MGWIEKVSGEKERFHFISLNTSAKPWFVVKIKQSVQHLFNKAMEGAESFNLSEFGEILLSGLGKPSQKIIDEVQRLYKISIKPNTN